MSLLPFCFVFSLGTLKGMWINSLKAERARSESQIRTQEFLCLCTVLSELSIFYFTPLYQTSVAQESQVTEFLILLF